MARRGENIRKRKDGCWEARIICSYNPSGKAKYCSVYGKSYQEAREKKKILLEQLSHESFIAKRDLKQTQKITVQDVAEEWLCSK